MLYNHLLPCHSPYSLSSSMPEATYMLMYWSEASCALSETSETSTHDSGRMRCFKRGSEGPTRIYLLP